MPKANVVALKADQVTNGGEDAIELSFPYTVSVAIEGVAPILFHRWNVEAVETKAKAAKGSAFGRPDYVVVFGDVFARLGAEDVEVVEQAEAA